jgi:hypothetical protein
MTYPVISDTGYTPSPRTYNTCLICGKKCRHLARHQRKYHKEVLEY